MNPPLPMTAKVAKRAQKAGSWSPKKAADQRNLASRNTASQACMA